RTLPTLSIRRLQGGWCSERHRSGPVMTPDATTVRVVWPALLPVSIASRRGELCCLTAPSTKIRCSPHLRHVVSRNGHMTAAGHTSNARKERIQEFWACLARYSRWLCTCFELWYG